MPPTSHKAHFSFGSPSGKSYLRLRLSRRFFLKASIIAVAVAALGTGSVLLAHNIWGVADGEIGSVYEIPRGPWGNLSAQPILVEAPASMLSVNFRLGDGKWYFRAASPADVGSMLRAASVDPADIATLLPRLQAVPGKPGLLAVEPPAPLVRGLKQDVRSSLYDKLAQIPENFAQVEPFRTTDRYLDDWLDLHTLSPEVAAKVKQLLWRRGSALLFSDYNLVADSIASPQEKIQLLKQLTRKSSMVITLDVPDRGDVEPLVEYWGAGGRADRIRPILAAMAAAGGGQLGLSNLLPDFARTHLYCFPDASPGTEIGPDCHWSSFNFFNTGAPDDTLRNVEGVQKALHTDYEPATGAPRFGDVILLTMPDGSSIHSAVHIADGIVFTKNGPSLAAPFIFSTLEDMLAFYPSSERIALAYYRRKGA